MHGDDHQRGDGANHNRVDKGAQHRDHALTHRIIGLCRGMGDGRAAQTGFVGKDAARHALLNTNPDARADKAAGCGGGCKGAAHDIGQPFGHITKVQTNDIKTARDVNQGHERHEIFRDPANALYPANNDKEGQRCHHKPGNPVGHTQIAANRIDHGLGLKHVANAEACNRCEERKHESEPRPMPAQTILDVIHRPADIAAA